MDEDKTIFPMDIIDRDPSFRPWNFRPQGYLVVILANPEEARRAETALVANGFAPQDIKLYTGEQILKTNERYNQQRGVAARRWESSGTMWKAASSTSATRVRTAA
jgi:hypothetical protein